MYKKIIPLFDNVIFFIIAIFPLIYILGSLFINFFVIIIDILFLYICVVDKKFSLFKNSLILLLFLFFFLSLLISIFDPEINIKYALKALFNIRFVIWSAAIAYILEKKYNIFYKFENFYLYIFYLVIISLICDILLSSYFYSNGIIANTTQIFPLKNFNFFWFERYGGIFFSEYILGTFLVFILSLYIIIFNQKINIKNNLFFIIFFIIAIIISGDRSPIVSFFSIIFFIFIFYRHSRQKVFYFFASFVIIFLILVNFIPSLKARYDLSTYVWNFANNNPWLGHYYSTIDLIKNNFIFGSGIRSFRDICLVNCTTHPHHYLLEILLETGFLGFFLILILIFNLIKIFYEKFNKNCFEFIFVSSLLFGYLFPLRPTGAFFSTWYGSIFYLLLGFFLYHSRCVVNKKTF